MRPYREYEPDSYQSYHGTTEEEIEAAEDDPKARVIMPFDSQDPIVIRIGDTVTTKYAKDLVVVDFTENGILLSDGKFYDEDRIAHLASPGPYTPKELEPLIRCIVMEVDSDGRGYPCSTECGKLVRSTDGTAVTFPSIKQAKKEVGDDPKYKIIQLEGV